MVITASQCSQCTLVYSKKNILLLFKQERDAIILALKLENERLLNKIRCLDEPEKPDEMNVLSVNRDDE